MEKPIPYISNDNFSQEDIFDYWNNHLSGHTHVKRTYPDVERMWRQFHGCHGSGGGIDRVFTPAGKQHDDLKKRTNHGQDVGNHIEGRNEYQIVDLS